MPEVSLTDGCRERWRPLAQHLAARFASTGGGDEGAVEVALGTILDVEDRADAQQPGFSALVVPLVIRALRRHRREQLQGRPAAGRPVPALQLALADAENKLARRLGRCPTVAEIANYLDVAEHQIVGELATGWPAGSDAVAAG